MLSASIGVFVCFFNPLSILVLISDLLNSQLRISKMVGPRGFMLILVVLKGSELIDIWLAKKFLFIVGPGI
jgi:hypothetical protein